MMPPDVHSSDPRAGEVLVQDLLILNGNTLSGMTRENLSVRTTGSLARAVEFHFDGEHRTVGESDEPYPMPGTFQEESILRIRLVNPPKAKKLLIRLVDDGHEIWAGTFLTTR